MMPTPDRSRRFLDGGALHPTQAPDRPAPLTRGAGGPDRRRGTDALTPRALTATHRRPTDSFT